MSRPEVPSSLTPAPWPSGVAATAAGPAPAPAVGPGPGSGAAGEPLDAPARNRLSPWWPVGMLLLLALSLAGIALAWNTQQHVHALEQELVRRQQSSQDQATEARLLAQQAADGLREQAAKLALVEERVAESSLQRSQVEDLIQSLSRSRDENVLADVEASLRVAMQQSAITGSAESVVSALKQTDDRLARYNQPRLERVRRAVARDLDRVRSASVVDVPALTLRLDEAARLVDDLPLLSAPERRAAAAHDLARPAAVATASAAAAGTKPRVGASGALAANAGASAQGWDDWMAAQARALWEQVGAGIWQEVKSLVRVTEINRPEAMLVTPEQAFFLRENLKLRLLNARLALLSRQFDLAQADLHEAQQALGRYFDHGSRRVLATEDLLRQVTAQSRQVSVPRPDDTLAALAALSAGR